MELSQYGEDVDEIVVCADSASFLTVSELQLCENVVSRRRRAVVTIIRESQFRDGVGATQVRLWSHELKRVFEDRLTTSDDHDWFVSQLTEITSSKFGMKWQDIVRTERADSASSSTLNLS